MLRKISKMSELEEIFKEAANSESNSVAVEMTIPNRNQDTEFVINKRTNINSKLYYYKKNFDENLVNTRLDSIKIVSAGYGNVDLF